MILSDLIFTTIQSKPVSTELPFIECGDPGKCQILVLFRNPKDTAVSFFHFHNNVPGIPSHSSWAELFSECMNGKEPASIKQIAEFFGFSPVAEQIQSTADRATFQAVTDKAQEIRGAGDSFLLCKGVVGDWKNLFTEAQNQEMDAKFRVCLGGTKLGAKLKYDVYCKV